MGAKGRQTAEIASQVFRVALTEVLKAGDGEPFTVALDRLIDQRIRENHWYRKLWRKVKR